MLDGQPRDMLNGNCTAEKILEIHPHHRCIKFLFLVESEYEKSSADGNGKKHAWFEKETGKSRMRGDEQMHEFGTLSQLEHLSSNRCSKTHSLRGNKRMKLATVTDLAWLCFVSMKVSADGPRQIWCFRLSPRLLVQ